MSPAFDDDVTHGAYDIVTILAALVVTASVEAVGAMVAVAQAYGEVDMHSIAVKYYP